MGLFRTNHCEDSSSGLGGDLVVNREGGVRGMTTPRAAGAGAGPGLPSNPAITGVPSSPLGRGAPHGLHRKPGFVRESESKSKQLFESDVAKMMYGFGDARAPLPESIALVDDIVCDFITRMTQEACKLSARRGKKLALEDIYMLVRKQPKMYYRARELNNKDKEIKAAKSDKHAIKDMGTST